MRCQPGATRTTSCDPSFVKAKRMATPLDGRLGQLLMRSRVEEAKDVVAADRERSPVGAIRKAPQPESAQRQRVPDLRVGSGIEEEDPAAASRTASVFPSGLMAIALSTSPSPCMIPMAAGRLRSVASR